MARWVEQPMYRSGLREPVSRSYAAIDSVALTKWLSLAPAAASIKGDVGPYVALFLLVLVGGAGVPMIGTAALTAAAILAGEGELSLDDVIGVACAAAVLGGVLGYGAGRRWGVDFVQRPGRWEERRRDTRDKGEDLYAKWGWLACFFIPSFVAGIARMRFVMFLIFNTLAAILYQFATALPAYGATRVVSGHGSTESAIDLAVGVVFLGAFGWWLIRRRRSGSEHAGASL